MGLCLFTLPLWCSTWKACEEGTFMKYQEVYYPAGPVFMCLNGFINFVGGEGWNNVTEDVACRQLAMQLQSVQSDTDGN